VALSIETLAHAWEGYDPLLLERAISVASSVARYAHLKRYAVGLAANCTFPNADRHIWLAPARETEQLPRILEALAMASPFTLAPLEEILSRSRRRLPLGASVVIVTGFLTAGLRSYLMRGAGGIERLALVWVGQQPAPELPAHFALDSVRSAAVAPDLQRTRLFEAVVALLTWAARDAPLLLVLEDAHDADTPSLELASYAARRIGALRTMMLVTRRELPLSPDSDRLEHVLRSRGVLGCELDLRPLASRLAGRSVGLALAGGGARAFAHIGVIEALLAEGVEIDRVSGCSVGATSAS